MPVPANATQNDVTACLQQHQVIENSIRGKLNALTLAQKTKLSELIDQWILKLTV